MDELKKLAHEAIVNLDEDGAVEIFENAQNQGVDLLELLSDGYAAGMQELGELFSDGEVFLPDLLVASEIMQIISDKINTTLPKDNAMGSDKMIMATVEGDVHDIGKGICCTLLRTKGIDVIDLGRDVNCELVVEKAEEVGAKIIGLSSLVTTTMEAQKKVIEILKARGIRDKYKVMVGGAPVTPRWAEKIGADAYTEDAVECANTAVELLAEM